MTESPVLVSRAGAVTRLQLNRPHAANALTEAMHWQLHDALDDFAADDSQRVCVIAASGPGAFCAGSDLKEHTARGGLAHDYPPSGYAGITSRFDLAKPVIAEVGGAALGGGLELVLACDLAVSSHTATFGLPEPLVGGVALALGIERLAQHVGPKRAAAMVLTGQSIDAAEAHRLGLVNVTVPPSELASTTRAYVASLLAAAPYAQRASKAVLGATSHDLLGARERAEGLQAVAAWRGSDDAAEGTRAFVERRTPSWNLAASVDESNSVS